MLTFLRVSGVLLIAGGFLFVLANCGIPYMFSGNLARIHMGCGVFALGWVLLIGHAVLFTRKHGWAASGITMPGLVVFGAGMGGAWWFLFGPRADSYPRIYGFGVLFFTLFIASQVLPRVFKKR